MTVFSSQSHVGGSGVALLHMATPTLSKLCDLSFEVSQTREVDYAFDDACRVPPDHMQAKFLSSQQRVFLFSKLTPP